MTDERRADEQAAKRLERERWQVSYTAHGSQALRLRALAFGNGRNVVTTIGARQAM